MASVMVAAEPVALRSLCYSLTICVSAASVRVGGLGGYSFQQLFMDWDP